ncbi:hypothetical protein [Flavobacterium sp.]|uniref:hypothetical protein n=1 Tax=Flavobacterium sp. TaxID=239 RepID=UPI003D111AEE
MKKVFLGMLVIALGFGTMSLTTSSNNDSRVSVKIQKKIEALNIVDGVTRSAPWNSCCE